MNKKLKHKNKVMRNTTQSGFSLLLVILIMSAMLVTTLIISDIVLEVGRSLMKVPHSEVALYSAEAGIENALYDLNKKYQRIDSYEELDGDENLEIDGATYRIRESDIDLIQESIDGDLRSGESLVIEYDLNFEDNQYQELNISFSGSGDYEDVLISVLEFELVGTPAVPSNFVELETTIDDFGEVNIVDWDNDMRHKIRIYNSKSSTIGYSISQGMGIDSGDPIVGFSVKSHGIYKDTERVVEIENLKWHVF